MEQGKFYKQAEEIAAKFNFDRVIYAGVENGYEYYRGVKQYQQHPDISLCKKLLHHTSPPSASLRSPCIKLVRPIIINIIRDNAAP